MQLALAGTPSPGERWTILIDGVASPYSHVVGVGQGLTQVGNALAGLDGDPTAGPATFDASSGTLTITGLAGKRVAFAVSGLQPDATATLSGTRLQDSAANVVSGSSTAAEGDVFSQAFIQFGGEARHNQVWTLRLTDHSTNTTRTQVVTVGRSAATPESISDVIGTFVDSDGYDFSVSGETLTIELQPSVYRRHRHRRSIFQRGVTANAGAQRYEPTNGSGNRTDGRHRQSWRNLEHDSETK